MNSVTIAVGIAFVGFGLTTLVLRKTRPQLFAKLEPMKQTYGDKSGYAVHVLAYSLAPIAVGIKFIYSGINGGSIF